MTFAGSGADVFSAYEAQHGTLLVVGFTSADTLTLYTQGDGRVQTVASGYGTTYAFANGSEVVLYGASNPGVVVVS